MVSAVSPLSFEAQLDVIEERLRKLSTLALKLSFEEVEEASHSLEASKPPSAVGLVVDFLSRFEAAAAAVCLARSGLKAGVDYAFLPEGGGGRFALALREGVGLEALKALEKLRGFSAVKPLALRVLKEWRAELGEVEGDVDEAIHAALRALEVKGRLLSRGCPRCGGAAARVVERVRVDFIELAVERACCGYVERAYVFTGRRGKV
jgi:hypothetical protein